MGVDIHTHIVKYNEDTNAYKELVLYEKENKSYERISPYSWRNYELFEILQNKDNNKINFPSKEIRMSALDPEFKDFLNKEKEYCYGFAEVSFADIKNYLFECPTVTDYDSDAWDNWKKGDPVPIKENPIKGFFERLCNYAEFADEWGWDISSLSDYKLIYYFDH